MQTMKMKKSCMKLKKQTGEASFTKNGKMTETCQYSSVSFPFLLNIWYADTYKAIYCDNCIGPLPTSSTSFTRIWILYSPKPALYIHKQRHSFECKIANAFPLLSAIKANVTLSFKLELNLPFTMLRRMLSYEQITCAVRFYGIYLGPRLISVMPLVLLSSHALISWSILDINWAFTHYWIKSLKKNYD